nr:hypothetical protein [Nanoarchaeota archaeon]
MTYIHNKIIIWIIISIMCSCLVLPADEPGAWDDYHGGDPLTNFVDPWHLRMHGALQEPADMYSWFNDTFFTVAEWEREVCLADLSTDVRNIRNVVLGTDAIENVYMTTVTITATKERGFNNTKLYEVSWYIVPYNIDALYRVYLKNGNDKEYFAGREGDDNNGWEGVSQYTGDSGYDARYLTNDYDTAVLEYREGGSAVVNEISMSVVNKTIE